MLAERIDSGIQQTVNPVVEQLSNKAHNVRETLGIWNRPFSPLSSGHPNPVVPPNTNLASQSEGKHSRYYIRILSVVVSCVSIQVTILSI